MAELKIGILDEGKNPPDERAPFTPEQCSQLKESYPCEVYAQHSQVRRIKDEEYLERGIELLADLNNCDILFGVKEVPIDRLIPEKTYFFFSHTIKEQPYNRDLLRAVLEKKIRLIDYECLVDERDMRLLGFGRFAGLVGAYNGLRMIGLRENAFELKKAVECKDLSEMLSELSKVKLNPVKICITGMGRVAGGTVEILEHLGIRKVEVENYLNNDFDESVYVQLAVTDYNKKKDGSAGERFDFFKNPGEYISNFFRFAEQTDFYIASHYWDAESPFIFTRDDLKKDNFSIEYIADISCDIDGPVASTIRPSTIEDPFYGIDKGSCSEVKFGQEGSLNVMAVDNLPCELPVDASKDFGEQLMQHVVPSLFNGDKEGILARATIAENGKLTERYSYLQDYVEGK